MHRLVTSLLVLAVSLLTLPVAMAQESATPSAGPLSSGLTVVASGLTNPRGFVWGPDGTFYVALAGHGGDTRIPVVEGFTVQLGLSSSVVTVADGCVTPLVQGLVSAMWEEPDWVWGAMDLAILDDQLYVLISGAGPTWLSPSSRSGVFTINDDGTMTLVADITTWLPEHPPAEVPWDYNADGSLFDLEATDGALLLTEAVGGQLIKVTPEGEISLVADLSEGHPVPTGLTVDADGNAFVAFQTAVPFVDGSTKVVKVTPDGTVSDAWTGLTRPSDIEIGPDGMLYVAELSTGNTDTEPFAHPNTGRILRQTGPDSSEVIAEGLDFPVGLGFGPDGTLYVSGPANGSDDGDGWLARVEMDGAASASPIAANCEAVATPAA